MKQFKITYQYQDFRTVQTNYVFISAKDEDSAKAIFTESWQNPEPMEILNIVQAGVL